MIRVRFDPDQLTGARRERWDAWLASAEKARKKLLEQVEAGQQPEFDSAVWTELKKFLLEEVFFGKCAYCESRVITTSWGDAEHYRPKGKVTIRKDGHDEVVMWHGAPHPGYYWLAYDWHNLLPSCQRCNSGNGKMNQFPVERQHEGPPPRDWSQLDEQERPLLLHPYRDNPAEHLRFGLKGAVAPLDERGRASIEVYGLDRGDITPDRQREQENAWMDFKEGRASGEIQKLEERMRPWRQGRYPYSLAALQYIALMRQKEKEMEEAVLSDGENEQPAPTPPTPVNAGK